jgi:endonuclease III
VASIAVTQLADLLKTHGRLFSADLGIDLERLKSAELFKWFLASMLFGARITQTIAVRTYNAFVSHDLTAPQAIAEADFNELLQIMAEGGYVRYDNITSRKVQNAARKLIVCFEGDLNRLHQAAAGPAELIQRLREFKGVGPATVGIFLRELRGRWEYADPPLGELAQLAAEHLGIGDPQAFGCNTHCPATTFAT